MVIYYIKYNNGYAKYFREEITPIDNVCLSELYLPPEITCICKNNEDKYVNFPDVDTPIKYDHSWPEATRILDRFLFLMTISILFCLYTWIIAMLLF